MCRHQFHESLGVHSQRGRVVLDGQQVVDASFQHQSARDLQLGVQGV